MIDDDSNSNWAQVSGWIQEEVKRGYCDLETESSYRVVFYETVRSEILHSSAQSLMRAQERSQDDSSYAILILLTSSRVRQATLRLKRGGCWFVGLRYSNAETL